MQGWLDQMLSNLSSLPLVLQFLTISTATGLAEEIVVIVVIALARAGHLGWWLAISATAAGSVVSNMIVWWLGVRAGERALQWKMFSSLKGARMEKIRSQVQSKGWLAVLAARLIPGTRVGVFLLAGILGMSGWRFFLTLTAGTVVWILTLLGLVQAVGTLAHHHPWLAMTVVGLALGVGIWVIRFRRRALDAPT